MIFVLNGSPNKNSQSLSITKTLIENEEHKIIDTYNLNVSSCDDCKYCTHKIGCTKNDDMKQVTELLNLTNTLIISSPIYFGALSDKLLSVINRFQRYYGQKFDLKDPNTPKIKNLITITTQGSEKSFMNNGAKVTHRILKKLFDVEHDYIIQAKDCDNKDVLTDNHVLNQIKKCRKKIK